MHSLRFRVQFVFQSQNLIYSSRITLGKFRTTKTVQEEWNDAWESSWLPDDVTDKNAVLPLDVDAETQAFVEEMNEKWAERRNLSKPQLQAQEKRGSESESSFSSLENMKDYRLKKQRIHAGLWVHEIEKQEAELGGSCVDRDADGIDQLLDSCSEIFDGNNDELTNLKILSTSTFINKPDGWEATSKNQDGSIWEVSQREEDVLLQEFDRRIAYNKFKIASFIKAHLFSRRRPIDGWKYMIEELGPNAKKGKGSVSRMPTLSDASTQPLKEDTASLERNLTSLMRK